MANDRRTTLGKALSINQDPKLYGTFAEIGAGQEVARYFFQAGRASQTIAKSISAYDMTFSDEIYGKEKTGRYVVESRLNKMLEKEFGLLDKRLKVQRGDKTCFFVYANTVATAADTQRCHGWMGVRFQTEPGGPTSDVIMHVRMLDRHRLQQQEVIGILGVNLVFASQYRRKDDQTFIEALTEDVKEGRLAIDLIRFSGPAFKNFDDRLVNIDLVRRGLCEAVLMTPEGKIEHSGEVFFKKALFIQRGAFRPVTELNVSIAERGLKHFLKEHNLKSTETLTLFEISMHEVHNDKKLALQDYIDRAELLNELGYYTLITQFNLFVELKHFLRVYTQLPLGFVMGAHLLERLFDETFYANTEGGVLEGLGKLLEAKSHFYIFPYKSEKICMTAQTFSVPGPLQNIYKYFVQKNLIKDILDCDDVSVSLQAKDVRKLLEKKDSEWERHVPQKARELIKKKKLFGFK